MLENTIIIKIFRVTDFQEIPIKIIYVFHIKQTPWLESAGANYLYFIQNYKIVDKNKGVVWRQVIFLYLLNKSVYQKTS
jgi:hypothetical protein